MTRITLILVLFISQLLVAQDLQSVTKKYNTYAAEANQGVVILVEKEGKTEVSTIGKGNFNEHTVFNIGSATKKLTAILILQEVEKGSLKLSDNIGKFLDPIKNVDMSLSIETLLRHKSGLGELVGDDFVEKYFAKKDRIYNQDFLMNIPKKQKEKIGKFNYCNTNYILLGKILEKVADKSYFDLLRERIFIPSNMTESYPYVSKNLKNLAKPVSEGKDVSEFLDYRFYANYAYAAGSVASTLNDMVKFYKNLFEKKTLLSNKSLAKLINFDDGKYSLGMVKFDNGFVGHGGNNMGYSYREFYNPNTKKMILYFSNGYELPFGEMIKKELLDYTDGKISNVTFNENAVNDFATVTGTYLLKVDGTKIKFNIEKIDNRFYMSVPEEKEKILLVSKEKNKLYDGSNGIELEVNPNNKDELTFRQNGFEAIIKRIK